MNHLGLLRHAKSDWGQTGTADVDRPLNARGVAAAKGMAPVIAECRFDLVLASTARRVRETVAQARIENVEWRDEIYGAAPDDLVAMVEAIDPAVSRLLIVGHNPTMHLLANQLAQPDESEERKRLLEKYPTAALTMIGLEIGDWREFGAVSGSLERFIRPRDL